RLHQVEVAQAAGAAVARDDLLDRAAEVDVEEVGCVRLLDERSRLGHRLRVRTEDLHADWALLVGEAQVGVRAVTAAPEALRTDELAHDDVGAEPPAEPSER